MSAFADLASRPLSGTSRLRDGSGNSAPRSLPCGGCAVCTPGDVLPFAPFTPSSPHRWSRAWRRRGTWQGAENKGGHFSCKRNKPPGRRLALSYKEASVAVRGLWGARCRDPRHDGQLGAEGHRLRVCGSRSSRGISGCGQQFLLWQYIA